MSRTPFAGATRRRERQTIRAANDNRTGAEPRQLRPRGQLRLPRLPQRGQTFGRTYPRLPARAASAASSLLQPLPALQRVGRVRMPWTPWLAVPAMLEELAAFNEWNAIPRGWWKDPRSDWVRFRNCLGSFDRYKTSITKFTSASSNCLSGQVGAGTVLPNEGGHPNVGGWYATGNIKTIWFVRQHTLAGNPDYCENEVWWHRDSTNGTVKRPWFYDMPRFGYGLLPEPAGFPSLWPGADPVGLPRPHPNAIPYRWLPRVRWDPDWSQQTQRGPVSRAG